MFKNTLIAFVHMYVKVELNLHFEYGALEIRIFAHPLIVEQRSWSELPEYTYPNMLYKHALIHTRYMHFINWYTV